MTETLKAVAASINSTISDLGAGAADPICQSQDRKEESGTKGPTGTKFVCTTGGRGAGVINEPDGSSIRIGAEE